MPRIPLDVLPAEIPEIAAPPPRAERRAEEMLFVQPRHVYAPPEGDGQIYLPNSLMMAAARVRNEVGIRLHDANMHGPVPEASHVGFNLLGAPYVPGVRRDVQRLLAGGNTPILGGRVITGFSPSQFSTLFGAAVQGTDDAALAAALGIDPRSLPDPMQTSLLPVFRQIPDADWERYLVSRAPGGARMPREISFFLAQGCRYKCDFCAADHTIVDPDTQHVESVRERYRDLGLVEEELDFLAAKADQFGVGLYMYLTNLDLFQTPDRLGEFAAVVAAVSQRHGIGINMRGLATVGEFLNVRDHHPAVLTAMRDAGLHTVGFGVDGSTPKTWHSIRKGQNTSLPQCVEAIRSAREEYGMTPELLMVFGHPSETLTELDHDVRFTTEMQDLYDATPRPHVAKVVPGSADWRKKENRPTVDRLLAEPEYFQALDFKALPSLISHPDPVLRAAVWEHYLKIATLTNVASDIIYPISPEFDEATLEKHRALNVGRFDW